MAWWNFWRKAPPESTTDAITAAAMAVKASRESISPNYDTWQREAWDFYDQLGEFRYAIGWKSEMISRVRLRAGKITPGQDEPALLDDGPAVTLMNELGGGVGGQSAIMESLATQINVPGEGYILGETFNGVDRWSVRSNDEIRLNRAKGTYETIDDELSGHGKIVWRELAADSLTVRVWRPHKRYRYLPDSPARSMRGTMRELELVNRKIQAHYLSRLATAGVFIMPDEVTFPVRDEFQDAADPFMAEWIETAREAIQNPGTASATVPVPMRIPAEFADKFKFIDFTIADNVDDIARRESAIHRLATQVDVPAEILLGMGDVNHWSAWQLEESAIKTHISSDVEVIVNALTIGYLHPRLKAMGEDVEDLVVWYDTSELSIRPDRSQNAKDAYDRLEISGQALRREGGFDEDDAPNVDELKAMVLRKLAVDTRVGLSALAVLVNDPTLEEIGPYPTPPVSGAPPVDPQPTQPDDSQGPPGTQDNPPPAPDTPALRPVASTKNALVGASSISQQLVTPGVDPVIQATTAHRITFGLNNQWQMFHPECCAGATISCPVAQASRFLEYFPGTPGDYECWLSNVGTLILGKRVFGEQRGMIPGHSRNGTARKVGTNGTHHRT
jgi:hypothetical protein